MPLAADVDNEYDPAFPNEYEKVVKKMRDKVMQEMLRVERQRENELYR